MIALYIFLYLLIGFCLALIWGFIELKMERVKLLIDPNIQTMGFFLIYLWPLVILSLIVILPIFLLTITFERIFKKQISNKKKGNL